MEFFEYRASAYRDFVESADLRALERTLFETKIALIRRWLDGAPEFVERKRWLSSKTATREPTGSALTITLLPPALRRQALNPRVQSAVRTSITRAARHRLDDPADAAGNGSRPPSGNHPGARCVVRAERRLSSRLERRSKAA